MLERAGRGEASGETLGSMWYLYWPSSIESLIALHPTYPSARIGRAGCLKNRAFCTSLSAVSRKNSGFEAECWRMLERLGGAASGLWPPRKGHSRQHLSVTSRTDKQ